METNQKICPSCGIQNQPDFEFCKTCGAALNNQPHPYAEDIDGVPINQIADFVGPNCEHFINKFRHISVTGKNAFSAIVFLLSFFLSPIIGSLWFFRRRVYKSGFAILAIGLVSVFVGFVNTSMMMPGMIRYIELFSDPGTISPQVVSEYISSLLPFMGFYSIIFLINAATAIFFGFNANRMYKNHVFLKIQEAAAEPDGVTREKLVSRGGVKATWVIVLIAYILLSMVISSIVTAPIMNWYAEFIRNTIGNIDHLPVQ